MDAAPGAAHPHARGGRGDHRRDRPRRGPAAARPAPRRPRGQDQTGVDRPAATRLRCARMYARLKALFQTHDEVLVMGGNRLGKTRCHQAHHRGPGAAAHHPVAAFDRSERASINKQQKMFHTMLPPEWRSLGRMGEDIYVKYPRPRVSRTCNTSCPTSRRRGFQLQAGCQRLRGL